MTTSEPGKIFFVMLIGIACGVVVLLVTDESLISGIVSLTTSIICWHLVHRRRKYTAMEKYIAENIMQKHDPIE